MGGFKYIASAVCGWGGGLATLFYYTDANLPEGMLANFTITMLAHTLFSGKIRESLVMGGISAGVFGALMSGYRGLFDRGRDLSWKELIQILGEPSPDPSWLPNSFSGADRIKSTISPLMARPA